MRLRGRQNEVRGNHNALDGEDEKTQSDVRGPEPLPVSGVTAVNLMVHDVPPVSVPFGQRTGERFWARVKLRFWAHVNLDRNTRAPLEGQRSLIGVFFPQEVPQRGRIQPRRFTQGLWSPAYRTFGTVVTRLTQAL